MSYFTPDVIAREQLPGAASLEIPTPTGGDSSLITYYNKKRKKKQAELFGMVKKMLEAFM